MTMKKPKYRHNKNWYLPSYVRHSELDTKHNTLCSVSNHRRADISNVNYANYGNVNVMTISPPSWGVRRHHNEKIRQMETMFIWIPRKFGNRSMWFDVIFNNFSKTVYYWIFPNWLAAGCMSMAQSVYDHVTDNSYNARRLTIFWYPLSPRCFHIPSTSQHKPAISIICLI